MSITKNSSIANPNIRFFPGSKITKNYSFLEPASNNDKPQDSLTLDSRSSKTKDKSKTKITIGLNFENGSTQTQFISGSVKNLISQISDYKIPETNKNIPVNIYISYNNEELKKLKSDYVLKNGKVGLLFHHFLNSVETQLKDISDQIISTKLAANILNIRHISFLDRLKKGHIPTRKFKNQQCVRSDDLFKLKQDMKKTSTKAMNKILQDEEENFLVEPLNFIEDLEVKISVGLIVKSNTIYDQKLSGTIKKIISKIEEFVIPKLSEKHPLQLTLTYTDKEARKLKPFDIQILDVVNVLYFHIFRNFESQLVKKPTQLISTKLAAGILNIQHESLMKVLERGDIPYSQINNKECLRCGDLFKYERKVKKNRSEALTKLIQSGF